MGWRLALVATLFTLTGLPLSEPFKHRGAVEFAEFSPTGRKS